MRSKPNVNPIRDGFGPLLSFMLCTSLAKRSCWICSCGYLCFPNHLGNTKSMNELHVKPELLTHATYGYDAT